MKADRPWLEKSEVPVADINLTQADADVLLAMEKHKVEDIPYEYLASVAEFAFPFRAPTSASCSFWTSLVARSY
jgi:hypothetical protein